MDHKTVEAYRSAGTSAAESSGDNALYCSLMLYELAEQCKVRSLRHPPQVATSIADGECFLRLQGLSGRTLRRLPVLAHARHIAMSYDATARPKLETWIEAMRKCAAEDNVELEKVNGSR